MILALTVTFLAFQQGAISPVTWLMLSEIFPLKIRGLGMGASAFLLWIVNFLVGFGFPQLLAAIGLSNTFFVFAVLGVGAIAFAAKYVPETKDKSLEDLEHYFKNVAGQEARGRRRQGELARPADLCPTTGDAPPVIPGGASSAVCWRLGRDYAVHVQRGQRIDQGRQFRHRLRLGERTLQRGVVDRAGLRPAACCRSG